jgi:hypothetical protein
VKTWAMMFALRSAFALVASGLVLVAIRLAIEGHWISAWLTGSVAYIVCSTIGFDGGTAVVEPPRSRPVRPPRL